MLLIAYLYVSLRKRENYIMIHVVRAPFKGSLRLLSRNESLRWSAAIDRPSLGSATQEVAIWEEGNWDVIKVGQVFLAKIARATGWSRNTLLWVMRKKWQLRPYKLRRYRCQSLFNEQKQRRVKFSEPMLAQWHNNTIAWW